MNLDIPTGTLDLARARFLPLGGDVVRLTTREVDLLSYLAARAGQDVSRDDLLSEVWGFHALSLSRAIDTAVRRLRVKIETDPSMPETLCTAHGEGYRLVLAGPHPAKAPMTHGTRRIALGRCTVDLDAGLVHTDGHRVGLTAQERALLIALADRPGVVVDADRLARLGGVTGGRPALSNAIHRLRAKIEPTPAEPTWLVSVRGGGYRLDVAPHRAEPTLGHLRETLWSVADHAGRVFGLEDCVVYSRDGNHLVQVAAFGRKAPARGELAAPIALRFGQGIVGTAARTGAAQRVADVRSDARYVADLEPARSELAVPILHQGEVVGVLDSESPQLGAYDTAHEELFCSLAHIAAAAVRDMGRTLAA